MDLDRFLNEEIGAFGKFQIFVLFLVAFPNGFSGWSAQEYIFTAGALPHRCLIPECDGNPAIYEPEWLGVAVPGTPGNYDQCRRYPNMSAVDSNLTANFCPAELFDRTYTIPCESYVHNLTNTVVYDFGLECQEWKRTLIGTFFTIGTLLVLPFAGYFSDKYGRKITLIINALNCSVVGLIRAWSINYEMFLILELVESTIGAGAYSASYLLVSEVTTTKYRVIVGVFMSNIFAISKGLLGLIAWGVPHWKTLTIVLYTPQLFIFIYIWILPESYRWLFSKGKYAAAEDVLKLAAKMNKKEIRQNSMHALKSHIYTQLKKSENSEDRVTNQHVIKRILKSPTMRRRICTTPFWWVSTTLVYYGLSINAVGLAGNMYLNYILVVLVEIPGYWTAYWVLDRIGRRKTIFINFMISAITCFIFPFIPKDLAWLSLIIYLLGKYSISVVLTSIYVYTMELYPTQYRHSLFAFSSMIGRIGSIIAPLTPALLVYWTPMPSIIFGVMAFLSGCLALTTPETLNCKLPDTIEEAESIGR